MSFFIFNCCWEHLIFSCQNYASSYKKECLSALTKDAFKVNTHDAEKYTIQL